MLDGRWIARVNALGDSLPVRDIIYSAGCDTSYIEHTGLCDWSAFSGLTPRRIGKWPGNSKVTLTQHEANHRQVAFAVCRALTRAATTGVESDSQR